MNSNIYNMLKQIETSGFKAYIVGGYVRDYLLGKESHDIDIATDATPKDILNIFKDYITTLYEYGNVILNSFNYHIEITTFRKDISYKDKRRPDKICYVKTLKEDIKRRDFTINSIYMDKDEVITDLFNAKNDINKRVIKMIGNPYERLKEDSLRILRAVRFATILNFKLDINLKRAIIDNKDLLAELSYDRKKEELFKIFTSDNKKYGIKLLKELSLIDALDLKNIDLALRTKDIIGIYAMCYGDNYTFTKVEKDLIKDIKALYNLELTDKNMYKYGTYILSIVCDLKKYNKKKYIKKYEKLPITDRKEINITGDEICEYLKIEPGPILKDIYDGIEDNILNKKLLNDKDKIKLYLDNL